MKPYLPTFKTDQEAEDFVDNADLTDYDLSNMVPMKIEFLLRPEFAPKTERVNMRLPKSLLDAVKSSAEKAKMPYQRYIRAVLENAVSKT